MLLYVESAAPLVNSKMKHYVVLGLVLPFLFYPLINFIVNEGQSFVAALDGNNDHLCVEESQPFNGVRL